MNNPTITSYVASKLPEYLISEHTKDGNVFLTVNGAFTTINLSQYEFTEVTSQILDDITASVSRFIIVKRLTSKHGSGASKAPRATSKTLGEKVKLAVDNTIVGLKNVKALPTSIGYKLLSNAMQSDDDFARVWHDNVTCVIEDSAKSTTCGSVVISNEKANAMADSVMRHLFGVKRK